MRIALRLLFVFGFFCTALLCHADKVLHYVPADSVILMAQDESNWATMAMASDSTAKALPITVGKAEKKAFKKGTLQDAAQRFLFTHDAEDVAQIPLRNIWQRLNAIGTLYATDGKDDVWVTRLKNSYARISTKKRTDLSLDTTDFLYKTGGFCVRIGMKLNGRKLTLHVPAEGFRYVFVNGHAVTPEIQKGFYVISRTWNSGDEVRLEH